MLRLPHAAPRSRRVRLALLTATGLALAALALRAPTLRSSTPATFDYVNFEGLPLVDREVAAGSHLVRWDGTDDAGRAVGSGRYFYRLRSGERVLTRDMTLVR